MTGALTGYNDPAPLDGDGYALIFNHISKCAGATFRNILFKRFAPDYYDGWTIASWSALAGILPDATHRTVAIGGHRVWGIHDLLGAGFRACYVTLLRRPLDRFISHYRYARSVCSPVRSQTEFLRQVPRNFMVHAIANGSLDLAIERLQTQYFMFGIVERFDDFLTMLDRRIGVGGTPYEMRNRSAEAHSTVDPDIAAEFNDRNKLDLALYNWAEHEFRNRMERIDAGPAIESECRTPAIITDESSLKSSTQIRAMLDETRYAEALPMIEAEQTRTLGSLHSHDSLAAAFLDSPPPFTPPVHLARMYEELGNREMAAHWYRRGADLNPEQSIDLASFLARSGDVDGSELVLRTALDAFAAINTSVPDSCLNRFRQNTLLMLAGLRASACDLAAAARLSSAALEINPLSWNAVRACAQLAENWTAALNILKPALVEPGPFGLTAESIAHECLSILSRINPFRTLSAHIVARHIMRTWRTLGPENGSPAVRAAIYGAGAHTEWLHGIVAGSSGPEVVAVLDDNPPGNKRFWDLAPTAATDWNSRDADLIILSSDTVAHQLHDRCRRLYGESVKVLDLYRGLPPGPYPKQTAGS